MEKNSASANKDPPNKDKEDRIANDQELSNTEKEVCTEWEMVWQAESAISNLEDDWQLC